MNYARTLPLMVTIAATLLLGTPCPGLAEDIEARNICLCREAIARTVCKPPSEVEYIDRYMNTENYSFNVFYAKKEERFICNVSGNEIRIKGNAPLPILRTLTVEPDETGGCAVMRYYAPECPRGPVRCCAPKTREDIEKQKEIDFWNRPIPELLEDELRTGIAKETNATRTPEAGENNQTN